MGVFCDRLNFYSGPRLPNWPKQRQISRTRTLIPSRLVECLCWPAVRRSICTCLITGIVGSRLVPFSCFFPDWSFSKRAFVFCWSSHSRRIQSEKEKVTSNGTHTWRLDRTICLTEKGREGNLAKDTHTGNPLGQIFKGGFHLHIFPSNF